MTIPRNNKPDLWSPERVGERGGACPALMHLGTGRMGDAEAGGEDEQRLQRLVGVSSGDWEVPERWDGIEKGCGMDSSVPSWNCSICKAPCGGEKPPVSVEPQPQPTYPAGTDHKEGRISWAGGVQGRGPGQATGNQQGQRKHFHCFTTSPVFKVREENAVL